MLNRSGNQIGSRITPGENLFHRLSSTLGRTKPWNPHCISNPFWQMEQGEPAQPELSTKVGLNSSLNVLPYTFWFLWVHHKEQICVFDDFNLSTNYYRANSPVWTWHMTFPLPPVNQEFLSTLANPSPLWQEQR